MKFYITDHALTQGIQEVETKDPKNTEFPKMLCWKAGGYSQHSHLPNWHRTKEAAVVRAEEMKKRKMDSLKKSLAKLEKLAFN